MNIAAMHGDEEGDLSRAELDRSGQHSGFHAEIIGGDRCPPYPYGYSDRPEHHAQPTPLPAR